MNDFLRWKIENISFHKDDELYISLENFVEIERLFNRRPPHWHYLEWHIRGQNESNRLWPWGKKSLLGDLNELRYNPHLSFDILSKKKARALNFERGSISNLIGKIFHQSFEPGC